MYFSIRNFVTPLIFLGALLFAFFACDVIPLNIKSSIYGVSLLIKDILVFSLPFVIFTLVFSAIVKIGAKAIKYIAIIIPLISCSNFVSTILSYLCTMLGINLGMTEQSIHTVSTGSVLEPSFIVSIKQLVSNDVALISGVVFGLFFGIFKSELGNKISLSFDKFSKTFFKFLIPVMPLFVMGTALKLQHEGMLKVIANDYISILFVFIAAAYGYVLLQYIFLSKFNFSRVVNYIRNMFPAVITAFGSMSSAAALPLSIKAAEQNLTDKRNAGVIVPSIVNIHLIGDCFFIPMIAISVMLTFGMELPTLVSYLPFALHFVLAKFAVAAVPGGGVLVMLPVMQKYLGMSPDMLGLVTALYILFDPIITMCNVTGNGAMAILFDKIVSKTK